MNRCLRRLRDPARWTNSVLTIFLILPSTQRSEKVKRRKGKRVIIVVIVSLSRGVRCRNSIGTGGWGGSQFPEVRSPLLDGLLVSEIL